MSLSTSSLMIFLLFITSCNVFLLESRRDEGGSASMSFPLTATTLSPRPSRKSLLSSSLASSSSVKYSMALIVSIPIGTPPQPQKMVLDTGSQLSWIQCKNKTPPTTSFDPSRSSTFSIIPCNHPTCKPRIPDFTLPTTCDQKRLCHYSYFYADGTLAEGNLVRERFTFSKSQTTPPLVLGCATESGEAEGILGMNLGRLSFASQAKIQKFSYCVPRVSSKQITRPGTFFLGQNPNSKTFQYIDLLTFPQSSQRLPNLDPLAYTVGLVGISIGGKRLNISKSVFLPDAGGSGQTMIDSGTQYTFLVEAAYAAVREEVVRVAGARMKKGYVYGGALDMCFDGNPTEVGRLIGDVAFEFEKGVKIVIHQDSLFDNVGGGDRAVHCFGIGRSQSLGVASNIIGNFHQQNLWVEFDIANRRLGFGKAACI